MTKRENIDDPNSCWNKAPDDEIVFILRAKDPVMIDTIRFWMQERMELGLDDPKSPKIQGAYEIVCKLLEAHW